MKTFRVLLLKEWREQTRNFKIVWIPLVFILFGILEPVTNYYLPEIMKSVGNLPEGATFTWPEFTGEDIFASLLGQYQFIGVLVIVLAFMGTLSGERKNGTATLLYVRPISYNQYFLSKWLVVNGIVLLSVWLGFLAAWYYIDILFNPVAASDVLPFIATYSLWMMFVVTVTLACSASLPTGGAAGVAIAITLIYQIIDSLIGAYWTISPWKIAIHSLKWFDPVADFSPLVWSVFVTVIAIIGLILFGSAMAKRNSSKTFV